MLYFNTNVGATLTRSLRQRCGGLNRQMIGVNRYGSSAIPTKAP